MTHMLLSLKFIVYYKTFIFLKYHIGLVFNNSTCAIIDKAYYNSNDNNKILLNNLYASYQHGRKYQYVDFKIGDDIHSKQLYEFGYELSYVQSTQQKVIKHVIIKKLIL